MLLLKGGIGKPMKYDMLLLRFGEFTLKGKNRKRFERSVIKHVKSKLKAYPGTSIIEEYGRMYVDLGENDHLIIMDSLRKVFGIVSISPVKVTPSVADEIVAASLGFMEELDPQQGTTFKVNARRVWKAFEHSSHETNHLVGAPILRKFSALKVDVRNPDIELKIEIREARTYLYYESVPAVGGFPRGSNGKAMMLLSGGIDSPVAAWSSMRRGLELEMVHFFSFPFTSQKAKDKVIELARILADHAGEVKLHLVPFTEVQTSFTKTGQDNLMITLMRRSMLRIATQLAEREGALAIVSGDSLGQVASQTLGSMNVIGRATDLPLLRPLVMMDKSEIVKIAEDIGTYSTSILPYEDCCTLFVPKSPTTNPNLRIVEKIEASIPELPEFIARAVEQTETLILRSNDDTAMPDSIQEDWF
ncbi:thiamine biosynthesis protein ThiI [Paenibacillus sp. PDC88]|nr:thiamine biosynthesis protein ThiI [Paenibacillus sp. PDC88]